jgi:epoxide hydrolase-like predicted phosphatase
MITTLIFDWGGVLTHDSHFNESTRRLSEYIGIDIETARSAFRHGIPNYEIGEWGLEQFWLNFCKQAGKEIRLDKFNEIFFSSILNNYDMLDLLQELKKKYKIVLLSNNYRELTNHILEKYSLADYFHELFFSDRLHMAKPHRKIYEHALEKINQKPENCIMIDDLAENLVEPKKMGMKTVQYKNISQLKKELRRFSVAF